MNETEWQRRLLDAFDRLLDVHPDGREAWIDAESDGDPRLAADLRALLAGHDQPAGPLDRAAGRGPASGEEFASLLNARLAGRYVLEREIGRGGMAVVYLARESKHDRPVVLKALRPELLPFLGGDRFEREVRIASRMSHPNIIGLIDSGVAGDVPFFVMPHVEGVTLRELLDRSGILQIEVAGVFLRDIAAGLAHAHRRGIVHRDLKPENVLCAGEHAYVMDFGIARPFAEPPASDGEGSDALTRPGIAVGTPRYMAPEQRRGENVDQRADLYAWALIASEMVGDEMPPAWRRVVDSCLRDDPAERPADAGVLVRAVEAPTGARSVERLAGRAWPWLAAAACLALVAWLAATRTTATARRTDEPTTTAAGPPMPLAVAPFRNETGDPSFDVLGRLTADWIAQGLQQADIGPVVPWPTTLAAAQSFAAAGGSPDSMASELATQLAAGTIVSGSIYRIPGNRLSFGATVTDVRGGRLLSALPPIIVGRDSAEAAIREVRDRVLGSLAIEQDPVLANLPGFRGAPPRLDAYRAYESGADRFSRQEYAEAEAEYERAFALDTTFLVARLGATVALYNQGRRARADSLLDWLGERRDRLSTYHDLGRRSLEAQRDGDGERAYRLELRRAEQGPTPTGSYNAANLANQLNRPADALSLLEALDPNAPGLRGWAQYWTQLAHARHSLRRYGEEYDAAAEMWARFPERRIATVLVARALAAAGRTAELDSALAAMERLPPDTYWSLGASYVVAGEEIRAHRGDNAGAARYLAKAVAWLESRLVENPRDRSHRYWLASAEYDLEHFGRARRLFADLAREYPERTDFRHHAAVCLAQLGQLEAARAEVASGGEPAHGHEYAARARVEAAAGEGERALTLLGEGLRRGIDGLPWLHATTLPDLGSLAEDPRYIDVFGPILRTAPMPVD